VGRSCEPRSTDYDLPVARRGERFLGRSDLAEQLFRQGVEQLDSRGETSFNSTMTALLALALCDQGKFGEAEDLVVKSRELGAEDDFATQTAWRMALARVLSQRGEHAAAVALADEAVALVDATDYLAWQAEAHEVRADALLAGGRRGDARAAFSDSLARYERKGVVPSVGRVSRRLEDL
jgi:predicted negative regulator of RcsB-dependent stress response